MCRISLLCCCVLDIAFLSDGITAPSTGSCRAILGDSLSSASYKNCRANMQAVIMPQRHEAVRHRAIKTTRKSPKGLSAARATLLQTRCGHTANQQLYWGAKSPNHFANHPPGRAHHCQSRACQRASSDWRLLVTTSGMECLSVILSQLLISFCSIGIVVLPSSVNTRACSRIPAPAKTSPVQGSRGRRLYLPSCTARRSFLELSEAEQLPSLVIVSLAPASQSGIQ